MSLAKTESPPDWVRRKTHAAHFGLEGSMAVALAWLSAASWSWQALKEVA